MLHFSSKKLSDTYSIIPSIYLKHTQNNTRYTGYKTNQDTYTSQELQECNTKYLEANVCLCPEIELHWRLRNTLENRMKQKRGLRDFPGGLVVRTPCSQCRGPGFNP